MMLVHFHIKVISLVNFSKTDINFGIWYFILDGTVEKQNWKYWSVGYPFWIMNTNIHFWERELSDWNSQICSHYCFDSILTGARFLDFFQNLLVCGCVPCPFYPMFWNNLTRISTRAQLKNSITTVLNTLEKKDWSNI